MERNEFAAHRIPDAQFLRQVRDDLPRHMGPYRLQHTLGVWKQCVELGKLFGAFDDTVFSAAQCAKLQLAGLMHDITKELDAQQHIAVCQKYGKTLTAEQLASASVLHQTTGAYVAAELYGDYIDDEIFHAISCHTTGEQQMSLFDKLLFLADYIEPGRTFSDCTQIRDMFYDGLPAVQNSAVRLCKFLDAVVCSILEQTISQLVRRKSVIDPRTVAAYNALRMQNRETE